MAPDDRLTTLQETFGDSMSTYYDGTRIVHRFSPTATYINTTVSFTVPFKASCACREQDGQRCAKDQRLPMGNCKCSCHVAKFKGKKRRS